MCQLLIAPLMSGPGEVAGGGGLTDHLTQYFPQQLFGGERRPSLRLNRSALSIWRTLTSGPRRKDNKMAGADSARSLVHIKSYRCIISARNHHQSNYIHALTFA